jgi:hypothetical protein
MTKTDGLWQEWRLTLTQNQFGILDLGHCYLFDIWDLLFGILMNSFWKSATLQSI